MYRLCLGTSSGKTKCSGNPCNLRHSYSVNFLSPLESLINALNNSDPAAAFAEVTNIASAIDQVQDVATESAVYYGRLESAENHLIQYESNIQDALSETEDVDMAQAIVELQLQEIAYITCLESAARIIQPSLVDFVK